MTENELYSVPINGFYQFTLYYGEKLFGFPLKQDDQWYIIKRTWDGDYKAKIFPEEIEYYEHIDNRNELNLRRPSPVTINGRHNFKTLVIVGAGASFDYSFNDSAKKPPLTKDLFNNSYIKELNQYPGVENLSSQILQAKDIELYFQRQWDKITNSYNPVLLSKIVDVQFYLHELFRNVSNGIDFRMNNYVSFFQSLRDDLIQKGKDEKALIVSFNYDTILEQSLERAFGYSFNSMQDYVRLDDRKFLLFKPHGSCNWIREFKTEFLSELGIREGGVAQSLNNLVYKNRISLGVLLSNLTSDSSILRHDTQPYYYPDLLIPFRSKDSYVMPDSHLILLDTFLSQVEKIIVLGWKGSEEKFKELLKKKLGSKKLTVLYVTAKDKMIETELSEVLPNAIFSEVAPEKDSKGTFTELNSFIQEYPEKVFE